MLNDKKVDFSKLSSLNKIRNKEISFARALCQETELILADEPTGALDEENSIKIMSILKDLNEKYSKTIIVVTDDNLVSSYCDRKLKMKDGKWF